MMSDNHLGRWGWSLRVGKPGVIAIKPRLRVGLQTRHRPAIEIIHDRASKSPPTHGGCPRRVQRTDRPALSGPARDIIFRQIFRQTPEPGDMGQSDVTRADAPGVMMAGQPSPHLLCHCGMADSRWEHVGVVPGMVPGMVHGLGREPAAGPLVACRRAAKPPHRQPLGRWAKAPPELSLIHRTDPQPDHRSARGYDQAPCWLCRPLRHGCQPQQSR